MIIINRFSFVLLFVDVMSTVESNLKNQSVELSSTSLSQPGTSFPIVLRTTGPLTPAASIPSSPTFVTDDKPIEKLYKKEKQILFEFDQIVKGIEIFCCCV